jgi:acetyltransferase
LRVNEISDVFALTEALAKQPRPRGNRLTIVTNAGGPGVLATDELILGGGALTPLSDATTQELNAFLPAAWSHNNPIDVLGDAPPDRYAKTLEIAARDDNADGLLVILTPQAMTDPTMTAEKLKPYAQSLGKPVLASWMGGATVAAGENILSNAGIPTFAYPDEAAEVFNQLWRYTDNLRTLYETPTGAEPGTVDTAGARAIIEAARAKGRTLLTEYESKKILTAYGIPTVETHIATTEDEAVSLAARIGYPVVLKLHSETVTHKTDVNGVHLSLRNEAAVRAAYMAIEDGVCKAAGEGHFLGVTVQPMAKLDGYEVILGASPDPQFGPVLLFGTGGQLVEVYQDRSLGLPPLTTSLARQMMQQTRIYKALLGVRGRLPVDMAALESLVVRFSQLIVEQPFIKEMDLNPLLASDTQLLALDARVLLYDPEIEEAELPRPAIRPYPSQYIFAATLKNGVNVTIRPIRPEDEPRMIDFHETLSEHSVALRYYQPLALSQRTAHERLVRVVQSDYDREMVLVAETDGKIIGVARLSRERGGVTTDPSSANFTLLISDEFQNQGMGTAMLRRLLDVARAEKVATLTADILAENTPMQHVVEKSGFALSEPQGSPAMIHAQTTL